MTARKGPKNHLCTAEVLDAVSSFGSRWTIRFAGEEIMAINEAVDREIVRGNLTDACTLTPLGEQLLDGLEPERFTGRLRAYEDFGCPDCRLVDTCWIVRCSACPDVIRHVRLEALAHVLLEHVDAHRAAVAGTLTRVGV